MKLSVIVLILGITATVILTHVPMSVFGGVYQRSFVLFPQLEQTVQHGQVSYKPGGIRFTSNDLAHFSMYFCIGLVGLIVVRPKRRLMHGLALAVLAGLAAVDEFTQGYFHRQPQLGDWMLDIIGLLCGWILASLIMKHWVLMSHGRLRRLPAIPDGFRSQR